MEWVEVVELAHGWDRIVGDVAAAVAYDCEVEVDNQHNQDMVSYYQPSVDNPLCHDEPTTKHRERK